MTLPAVVGISGASGAIYGIETLRVLKDLDHPAHLIISSAGMRTIALETDWKLDDVRALATETYAVKDIGAAVASGSFRTSGMIVAPCSMKTLSGIANGYADTLMARAADVTLKERRPLVLMVRETPLHKGHLKMMEKAFDLGALILPPMPAFYTRPETLTDIVHHSIARALDHLNIDHDLTPRWDGG